MFTKKIARCLVSFAAAGAIALTAAQGTGFLYVSAEGDTLTYGDYEYQLLDDGTAKITGYNGAGGDIEIPSEINGVSVTSIGDYAFDGCTSLTSVTIPDGVTRIEWGAFYGCTSLTSVTIPDGVTAIGVSAFRGCTSLTSADIPDSVESIGMWAFSGCTALTSVKIGKGVTSIGWNAFGICTSLVAINVADENEAYFSLDGVLFNKDEDKTELVHYPRGKADETYTIPNGVTSIGEAAFVGCKSLKNVTIPDSVTLIDYEAFYGCTSLTNVEIPDGITSISGETFAGCTSLASITIPDSVTEIETAAFSGTALLNNQTGIKYADTWVVDCDTDVETAEIKPGTKGIGEYAFADCTSLTSVTIPDSVTSIGGSAFKGCTSLTDVYYTGTEEEWKAIDISNYNECLLNATIHYNYIPSTDYTDKESGIIVAVPDDTFGDTQVTLVVNETTVEDENIENILAAYEIHFEDEEGSEVPLSGEVTVSLPVPEGCDGDKCCVYYVDGNGITDMNAEHKNGYLVFTTDHFSTYVITPKTETKTETEETTSDTTETETSATTSSIYIPFYATTTAETEDTTAAGTDFSPAETSGGASVSEPAASISETSDAGNSGTGNSLSPAQSSDSNMNTGVILAFVPAAIAAVGVIVTKKKK